MHRPRVRDASAVQGVFLTIGLAVAAFFPFLALYLRDAHGLDESQIGLVLACMAAARMIANPLWGHLSDTRIGRLTALQIGLAGSGAAPVLSTAPATPPAASLVNAAAALPAITLLMVLQAFFMDAQEPNIDAIALEHLGEDRMFDYGRIRGWSSLTYASGCLLFGAILQRFGIRWAMPLYGISALLVLAWSTTVVRDRPRGLERHGRLGSLGAVFRHAPRFWGFLVAAVLVWTGFNAAWNFIGPRIEDQGGGPFLIGLGTALGGVVEVPVMRSSSRLQRRFGLRLVYMAGCVVYGLTFLLWGSVSDPTILSMLAVFEGIGFSLLFTTGVVIVGRLLPRSLYSTGNAVGQMVSFGIGPILGAGLGGFVYQHLGAPTLYLSACVLALGAALVAWFALATPALSEPDVSH
jgi:MFS transporter, PPP family, 3-phenylpropionic acid transporter